MVKAWCAAPVTHMKLVINKYAAKSTTLPKEGAVNPQVFFKRDRIVHGLTLVLFEPNGGALLSAFQLEQTVKSPISDGRRKFSAAEKQFRVTGLHSPTAAVIESALLMLLIGWIDYKTTDFAITLFYFAPVVLASWRAGRKARWLLRHFAGRQF
jgi:hypothetical protein